MKMEWCPTHKKWYTVRCIECKSGGETVDKYEGSDLSAGLDEKQAWHVRDLIRSFDEAQESHRKMVKSLLDENKRLVEENQKLKKAMED